VPAFAIGSAPLVKRKPRRKAVPAVRFQGRTEANWRRQMSKRSSAKYKLDRRMGENVFGRPKSPVNKREYGPGQHGQRRKGKISDFGIQLRAKQKLRGYYGDVTEKQFKRTYTEASKMKGDASQNLIGFRLSRQVRADDLVCPPAGQPRPRPRQRHQVQHRVAPDQCRRRNHAGIQGAGDGAGARGARPRRARHS
jgi:hypothetical protein